MITKVQLVAQGHQKDAMIEKLRKDVEERDDWSLSRRKNFTAVLKNRSYDFRADLSDSYYRTQQEDSVLTWEQIFAEIGKLIMCNRSTNWETKIDHELNDLKGRLQPLEELANTKPTVDLEKLMRTAK